MANILDVASSMTTHINTTMEMSDPNASMADKATSIINSITDVASMHPLPAIPVNIGDGFYNTGKVFDDWKNDREIQASDITNISSNIIMAAAGIGAFVGTSVSLPVFATGAAIAGGVSLVGSLLDETNDPNYKERFKDGAENLGNDIRNNFQNHINQMQDGLEQASNNINNALNKATNKVQDYANSVADGAEQVGNNINNAFEKAVETVQDYVNRAKDGAEQMGNDIQNNAQNHANQMQNGAAQAGDDIQNALSDYWNRAKDGLE